MASSYYYHLIRISTLLASPSISSISTNLIPHLIRRPVGAPIVRIACIIRIATLRPRRLAIWGRMRVGTVVVAVVVVVGLVVSLVVASGAVEALLLLVAAP